MTSMPERSGVGPADHGGQLRPGHGADFGSYYRAVYKNAVRYAASRCAILGLAYADADDCVQKAMLAMNKRWPDVALRSDRYKWNLLRRMIFDDCKDLARWVKRDRDRRILMAPEDLDRILDGERTWQDDHLPAIDAIHLALLAELPERDREILLKDVPDDELARELGMTKRALQKHRSRLCNRLRARYDHLKGDKWG